MHAQALTAARPPLHINAYTRSYQAQPGMPVNLGTGGPSTIAAASGTSTNMTTNTAGNSSPNPAGFGNGVGIGIGIGIGMGGIGGGLGNLNPATRAQMTSSPAPSVSVIGAGTPQLRGTPTLTSQSPGSGVPTGVNLGLGLGRNRSPAGNASNAPGSSAVSISGSGAGVDVGAGAGSDPVHASVSHLLSRAYSLPCSIAAQAFTQLVQPTARFQLALDALLPLLDTSRSIELVQRILVSFILYSLYAPHPIAINPFRSVLFVAYVKEREKAVEITNEGKVSPNEQLVWVLWKILKGDGNDIGPYSPSALARSPLPTKLRAVNLVLDDELYYSTTDLDDVTYSYFQKQQNNYGQSATSGNNNGISSTSTSGIPVSVPATISPVNRSPITHEDDRRNERIVQGMRLLLTARGRVLTLSEQRVLFPLINDVTSSRIITSLDFTPIVAHNTAIAHPLFVGLLNNASDDNNNVSCFLDVLPFLPPSLASMDLMGRLLRDQTYIKVPGYSTVADLVRMEVLGRFIHESINWLERAERDEKEGLISDDRFAKGVQNLCRFFNSLTKFQIVDPSSDADSAEIMHFTLRYSRFEDANALYRLLALSRY